MTGGGGSLPVVLVPVGVDDAALDACLAALDAATPAETRVWLIDDAQAGPRGVEIVQRWLRTTPLRADYTRRPRMAGEVQHLDEALRACGDADVAVLAGDAIPAPGWLSQLVACFARDASIGSATPWCNAGESAGWPRVDPQSPPEMPPGAPPSETPYEQPPEITPDQPDYDQPDSTPPETPAPPD